MTHWWYRAFSTPEPTHSSAKIARSRSSSTIPLPTALVDRKRCNLSTSLPKIFEMPVKSEVVGVDAAGEEEKKFQVVLGGEEKDLLEKERLQEAQRYVHPLRTRLMIVSKTPCLFGIHIPLSQELLPHWVYRTKQESKLFLPIDHDQSDKEMTKTRMICSKLITLRWKMKPSLLMCRCLQSAWRPV
jgi:hypothetical protein